MSELSTEELIETPLEGETPKDESTTKEPEAIEPKVEERPTEKVEPVEPIAAEKPKKVSGFKRRLDRANARAEAAEEKLRQFEAPKVEPKTELDPDDYENGESDLGYIKDVARKAGKDAYFETKESDRKQDEQTKIDNNNRDIESNYTSKMDEVSEKYEDFEDVFQNNYVNLDPNVLQAVKGSEHAGELTYQILKDKALGEKLANMTQLEGIKAIGRMEAELSTPAPGKKVSSMTKPFKPVGTGKSISKLSYSDDMNQESFDENMPFEDLE